MRDFEILKEIYENGVKQYETNSELLVSEIKDLGEKIKYELGFHWPYLEADTSKYMFDLYNETLNLNHTYYRT